MSMETFTDLTADTAWCYDYGRNFVARWLQKQPEIMLDVMKRGQKNQKEKYLPIRKCGPENMLGFGRVSP